MHFVQTTFLLLSLSLSVEEMSLWDSGNKIIFRGNGREEEKASFILHFKTFVIINVA